MRTHQLEGRKREERVGELRNVACHKRGLTNWRGGEGGVGFLASKCGRLQIRIHLMEGGEREEPGGELQNLAGHKPGLTNWRGGTGRNGVRGFQKMAVS